MNKAITIQQLREKFLTRNNVPINFFSCPPDYQRLELESFNDRALFHPNELTHRESKEEKTPIKNNIQRETIVRRKSERKQTMKINIRSLSVSPYIPPQKSSQSSRYKQHMRAIMGESSFVKAAKARRIMSARQRATENPYTIQSQDIILSGEVPQYARFMAKPCKIQRMRLLDRPSSSSERYGTMESLGSFPKSATKIDNKKKTKSQTRRQVDPETLKPWDTIDDREF